MPAYTRRRRPAMCGYEDDVEGGRGATPSAKAIGSGNGQAGAVSVHITGTGDFRIAPVGGGTGQTWLVPPPPK